MRNVLNFMKSHLANRAAAVVGAMVIAVGAVGGIAYAVSSGSSPATAGSTSNTSSTPPANSTQGGASAQGGSATQKKPAGRALFKVLTRAVHAEIVLPEKGGTGYRTVDLDRGTITSLSSTSITINPVVGGSPVTAAITSTTHEPKNSALSQGETVVLVYSGGDALIVRPVKTASSG